MKSNYRIQLMVAAEAYKQRQDEKQARKEYEAWKQRNQTGLPIYWSQTCGYVTIPDND